VAQTARAQAPAPSSIIGEIHFSGSHYAAPLLAATSGLKPGDSVTQAQLQDVANRFAALGAFSRANYNYTTRNGKLILQFDLQDAPTVPVSFDNFPWFTDDELFQAIRSAVPLFDGNAPMDGGMLDQMDAALTALLPTRKVDGTIEHMLMAQPIEDGMMVQFRVKGPALTVDSLEYSDALAKDSEPLKDRNPDLTGKPFSRFAIQVFEQEQVRPLYLQTGHLQAKFGPPQPRFSGDPNQPLSEKKVIVFLPVDPGPVFQMLDVTATGNSALDSDAITKLVAMPAGQLADGMRLAAAWQRIEQEYRHRGFLDVKVEPKAEFNIAGATVSYKLAITEGPQYHMHDLILTGLSPDAGDALRLRWELRPGAVLDGKYVDDMLVALKIPTKQIFGDLPVHYSKVGDWLRTDPATKTADVLIDFQ
jgi:outer membrane protein assembly factor BamA